MKRSSVWKLLAMAVCAAMSVSCSSSAVDVHGMVNVDGKPLDTGTIHFQPKDGASSAGSGAAVANGAFTLPEDLAPGMYSVVVDGFRKTGRMVADPQRGQVAETVQLRIQNHPIQVQLPPEDSEQVRIELKTASK